MAAAERKSALVLGGNGMMGAEIVLVLAGKGYEVVSLNRGSRPWDFADRVLPSIARTIVCNRKHLAECTELAELLDGSAARFFDLVVDCSGYHGDWVEEAARLLRGHAGLYVYISTDSVYEVCVPATHEGGLSVEEDAVRPSTREEVKAMKKKDSYGHAKLRGEEALERQLSRREESDRGAADGIPYVSLRLADVVGPRDVTDRWLLYQAWVLSHDLIGPPLGIRKALEKRPLSFVYR
jgi:nucleoside-diphosphate-sugar epimerase